MNVCLSSQFIWAAVLHINKLEVQMIYYAILNNTKLVERYDLDNRTYINT